MRKKSAEERLATAIQDVGQERAEAFFRFLKSINAIKPEPKPKPRKKNVGLVDMHSTTL